MTAEEIKRELNWLRDLARTQTTANADSIRSKLAAKYRPLIAHLPEEQRAIMERKFLSGQTNKEVAVDLHYSVESIKKLTNKAIANIAKLMGVRHSV